MGAIRTMRDGQGVAAKGRSCMGDDDSRGSRPREAVSPQRDTPCRAELAPLIPGRFPAGSHH